MFWPDATEARARNNLRQFVHQLRAALPDTDQFLTTDANAVHWRASPAFTLDVAEFESAIAQAHVAQCG